MNVEDGLDSSGLPTKFTISSSFQDNMCFSSFINKAIMLNILRENNYAIMLAKLAFLYILSMSIEVNAFLTWDIQDV